MTRFLPFLFLCILPGIAAAQPTSNRAIINQLDDMEFDQQMRDIQKRAEQQPVQVPRVESAKMSFDQEVKTRPDKYRFIDRSGGFDYYIPLPIKRWPDGDISFTTVLLSDEVLESGGVKYSKIITSVFLDCKKKSARILDGHALSPNGKIVSTVEGRKITYDRNTKIWSKIDSLYCQ